MSHLLGQCVSSILAQNYSHFEILIMDNCSSDRTAELVASFNDARLKYIRNEVNIGHVRNFNKGITLAQGKYVWLVSADDWLRGAGALQRYVEVMEGNPRVGYVFSRAMEVHGSNQLGPARWTDCGKNDRIWNGRHFLMRLIRGNCIVMSSVVVRKECYERLGLFSLEMPHANDWYLWCVFAVHHQVGYLAEPMVFVRIHEESLTSSFNQENKPVCVIDELTALWRAARLAEDAGVISDRRAFNQSIATIAARGLTYGPRGRSMPGLSEADLELLLHEHARDSADENDFRARVHAAIGDEEFWHAEYRNAAQAYRLALKRRPWWARTWGKYLLLSSGSLGLRIRRLISNADAWVEAKQT
jgi:Glycosyl transferase family 2